MILTVGTLLATDVVDPERYETYMKKIYESQTLDDTENLRLCKIFAEKGKVYKAMNRSDKFYDETVKRCERRIQLYCGALMTAKKLEKE